MSDASENLRTLVPAARKEGVVNVHASGPPSLHEEAVRRFEKKFPGIRVELQTGYAGTLVHSIEGQRGGVDVAILQTVQDFERWAGEGALRPFEAPGFYRVFPSFKHPDGAYVGVQVSGIVYAYHSDRVAGADVPRSAEDFLDPRFEGKIVSGFPHRDDVVLYLYHTILEKYGWPFMERLMANRPAFVDGHAPLARAIAAGEYDVTFDAIPWLCLADERRGAKTKMTISNQDPMPIWAQIAAIFEDAPHPHAAKLYLAWCLSKEEQELMTQNGTWSSRDDVAPPASLRPLAEYRVANQFREFMMDAPRVLETRRRLEQCIAAAHESGSGRRG